MKRGDVYWINFTDPVGGEIQKRRPAVIVSNDAANRFLNRVQVIPLTTKVSKLFPSEALVTVKGKPQKAMADQLATVSKTRMGNKLGSVGAEDMAKIELAIMTQLGITVPETGV